MMVNSSLTSCAAAAATEQALSAWVMRSTLDVRDMANIELFQQAKGGVRSHRVDGTGAPIEEDSALCSKDRLLEHSPQLLQRLSPALTNRFRSDERPEGHGS